MNLIGTKEKEYELTKYKALDRFQSISLITLSTRMITHLSVYRQVPFIFSNSDSTEYPLKDKANRLTFHPAMLYLPKSLPDSYA